MGILTEMIFLILVMGLIFIVGLIVAERVSPFSQGQGSVLKIYQVSDILIMFAVQLGGLILVEGLHLKAQWLWPSSWAQWLGGFFLVFVVFDFILYWVHRFSHGRWLWPLHHWHHTTQDLNWISGFRSSFLELLLFTLLYALIDHLAPQALIYAVIYYLYSQFFLHWNVSWKWAFLDKILVTPHFHRLHHVNEARFQNKNFGTVLTIWDHVFQTYEEPQQLQSQSSLAVPANSSLASQVLGI